MKRVVILSGVPGSGKSTYARHLCHKHTTVGSSTPIVVSADDFFTGSDGEYRFNAGDIGQAHRACFRNYLGYVQSKTTEGFVVVDNTNMGEAEIAPYYLAAEAYGWDVEIHVVDCTLEEALARQTHNVPEDTIRRMYGLLMNRKLPPWWKSKYVILYNVA